MSGFTANGGIYVQGGTDGTTPVGRDVLDARPTRTASIPGWKHLDQTDLGEGLEGSAAVVSGSHAFLFAGPDAAGRHRRHRPDEPRAAARRSSSSASWARRSRRLKLDGEVGQQIGYLNAATVGAINFVLLILIGYAFNHRRRSLALAGRGSAASAERVLRAPTTAARTGGRLDSPGDAPERSAGELALAVGGRARGRPAGPCAPRRRSRRRRCPRPPSPPGAGSPSPARA